MTISFKKELYEKEALMKAAYHFVDRAYIHLDADEEFYYVEMKTKKHLDGTELENEFQNELLAQMVRLQVYRKTHVLRELLMARTLASTIVEQGTEIEDPEEEVTNIDEILTDWFKLNENN